jgi:hypothetical protein
MKTAEQKALKYAIESNKNPSEYDVTYNGYIAGYEEAIRWRDPKVELPENGEPVIVKYMTARGIKKYGIAKYFELGIGNPWTIEGSTGREVIGWRPIE